MTGSSLWPSPSTQLRFLSEEQARELVMAGTFDARDDLVIDDSFEGITSVKKAVDE